MAHTARRRLLVPAVIAAAVLTSGSSCFAGARSAIDDLARFSGLASDDVRVLAQRDAQRAAGRSADEVAGGWLTRVQQAGRAYASVPTEARSVACDVTTSWVEAILTGQLAEFSAVVEVTQAVGSLNQTFGAKQLGEDLQDALDKREQGQPYYGLVLAIKAGTCQAASQPAG